MPKLAWPQWPGCGVSEQTGKLIFVQHFEETAQNIEMLKAY